MISDKNVYFDFQALFRFIKQSRGVVAPGTVFKDISVTDIDLNFINSITNTEVRAYLDSIKGRKVTAAEEKEAAPQKKAPILTAPATDIPVVKAPVVEAPVVEAPVVEAPVVEAPVIKAPVVEAPVIEAPVVEAPNTETSAIELPVTKPTGMELQAKAKPFPSDLTGYPSIDRPWLKYFKKEYINAKPPHCTMYEYVYNNNQDNLDGTAINYFGKKTSYAQFFKDVDTVAKSFLTYGVKTGDIVTIVSLTCPVAVTAMYALNKIGAVPNFVNVLSTAEEFEEYFKDAGSDVIITLDLFGKNVFAAAEKYGARTVIVASLSDGMPAATAVGFKLKVRKLDRSFMENELALPWSDFIAAAEFCTNETTDAGKSPDTLAYLGHTGGTTGFPKSVYLNDNSFNYVAFNYNMSMEHGKGDVFLNAMIPYVVYSAIDNIHMPLSLSMELVIIPKFDPNEWPTYIKKYHPNHCAIIPAYLAPMTTNEELRSMDLTCLRTVGMGGDGMNIPLEEAAIKLFTETHSDNFNPLIKGYGMTEVCATAITEFSFANKVGSVGIPFPGNVVATYNNEEQRECKYYEVGEIIMQCGSMMMSYKDNEEENRNLFRTHSDGSQWIHTGDLGYIDEDGFLFIEGRMKRVIMTVIDGKVYKIFPSKVENELSQHSGVYDVCVVKATDGTNQVLKAFVVPEESYAGKTGVLEKELRARCEAALPENMWPVFYEMCKDFPRTAAGKIDFNALES